MTQSVEVIVGGDGITVELGAVVGAQGPPGPVGGAPFEYVQTAPAATWTVTHDLGHFPVAAVLDSTGAALVADIVYPDVNTAVIVHSAPASGRAVFI